MKLLRNSLPPGSIPYADEEYWEEYWDDEDDDDWDDDELWKEEEEEFQAWRKHTQLTLLPRLSETEARVRWEARKQKVEAEAVATKEEEFQAWRKQKQPGSFVSGLSEAEARQKHAALRDLQLKVAIKLGESEELEEELKEFEKERRRWVARGDVNKKIADLKLQVPVTEAELEEAEDALEDLEEELEEEEKTDGDDSYGDDDDYEDDDESDDDDEDLYGDKLTPQEGLAPGTGKCEADSNENCSGWCVGEVDFACSRRMLLGVARSGEVRSRILTRRALFAGLPRASARRTHSTCSSAAAPLAAARGSARRTATRTAPDGASAKWTLPVAVGCYSE